MSAAGGRRPVGVAVAGFGWMGRAHTQAHARVLHHFPELPLAPELVAGGRLGSVTHARFRLFSDYAAHPPGRPGLALRTGPGRQRGARRPCRARRRMNELAVSVGQTYQDQPVSTVFVGPGHGDYAVTLDAMAGSAESGTWVKVPPP